MYYFVSWFPSTIHSVVYQFINYRGSQVKASPVHFYAISVHILVILLSTISLSIYVLLTPAP